MVSNFTPYSHPAYMPAPQTNFDKQPYSGYLQSSIQSGQQRYLKGRPVSCFEEAQSSPIDWDGSLHVFPDIANKRIYTKQLANDGSCAIRCYVEQALPQNTSSSKDEQANNNKIIQELTQKVEMLEQELKGLKNDTKSNATVPNVRTA